MEPKHSSIGLCRIELNHMTEGYSRVLKKTIGVFRDAVAFFAHVAMDHHEELSRLKSRE